MNAAFAPMCALTLCWVGLLVLGHARAWRSVVWAAKPAASSGFLLASYSAGALHTPYGRWVFAAQALGWAGDVLLIPKHRLAFLLGMICFMLGHLGFAAAFLTYAPGNPVTGAAAAVGLGAAGLLIHHWVMPTVPRLLKTPVRMYIVVITIMVTVAIAALDKHPHPALLLVGASLFYLSDLCVARQRFVRPMLINQAVGLPLYYVAQLVLAASVR